MPDYIKEDLSKTLNSSSDGSSNNSSHNSPELSDSEFDELYEGPAPWHFKLLIISLVIYLGWRGLQAIIWIWNKFF